MRSRIVLIALVLASLSPGSRAAEGFDNCTGYIDSVPAVIGTQGVWCMRSDLSSNIGGGTIIQVQTNNVTIDCNHFKLGGLGGGLGTATRGIVAETRQNLTVRNCNIRGFYIGLATSAGGGHLVEDNRFEANRYVGIFVESAGSIVRDNLVSDTGDTSIPTGATFGIAVANGVDVVNNTVDGVSAQQASANTYGISSNANGNGATVGNRVRDVVPGAGGTPFGIWNQGINRTVVSDNTLVGAGQAGSVAIRCANGAGSAFNNNTVGFATAVLNCSIGSNFNNPN